MIFTSIWVSKGKMKNFDEQSFKDMIPLELMGKSLGSKMTLVIFEGIENLSATYLQELEEYFIIRDYSKEFKDIISQYPNINAFYSPFERNCFLRWIAFKQIAKDDKQFWHLDSDVVLNVPLSEIVEDTKGKTFVLQNCPAFVSVSNKQWFKNYETELKKLESNIKLYSDYADTFRKPYHSYRNPIGSDQDLMEYLVFIHRLPQNKISNDKFSYLENPLHIKTYNSSIKRLPFIHYQGTFCFFANAYLFLWKLGLRGTWMKNFIYYWIEGSKFRISFWTKVTYKILRFFNYELSRTNLIKEFQNGSRLIDLLNFLKV